MKKMYLIVNPKSGMKKSKRVFESVQKVIKENEWELKTVYTERRGHATELAQQAVGYDRIVCMGGDGTFNETVNGFLSNPDHTELGYIPSGSTNDFASGLGLPKSIARNAVFASTQAAFPTDIGMFEGDGHAPRYFSYVASFGLFADVSYSTSQDYKNRFGHLAYIFGGLRTIADFNNFKPFKLRIEFPDGDAFESEFIFGAVSNSTSLGGVLKLDRKTVHVNDGVFEVLLIKKPKNFAALTQTITELVNNKFRNGNIFFGHVKSIKFISSTPLKWTLDGEFAGELMNVDVSVKHDAFNLVRPPLAKNPTVLNRKK